MDKICLAAVLIMVVGILLPSDFQFEMQMNL